MRGVMWLIGKPRRKKAGLHPVPAFHEAKPVGSQLNYCFSRTPPAKHLQGKHSTEYPLITS